MIPPQRSDRKDYSTLRDPEQNTPEPTRPENVRSPGWAQSASLPEQEKSALAYNKAANERAQQQHAERQDQQQGQQKEGGGVSKDAARTLYEQSVEKNATREVDHAAARANWEKALQSETPAKTPQQEQDLQKAKDKDLGY
jgi:hypothetical protein